MRRTAVAALAVALASAVGLPLASADDATVTDPTDDITNAPFDIASASHGHTPETERYPSFLVHTVTADGDVTDEDVAEGEIEFRFNFDTKGDADFDRSILVELTDDGYRADMWRDAFPLSPGDFKEPNDWVGFARVVRPDESSIAVEFPVELLGRLQKKRANSYRWMVEAYKQSTWKFSCGENDEAPCWDRTKAIRHTL